MRKILRKTLALISVLALTVCMFTGCSSKPSDSRSEGEDYSSKVVTYGLTSTWSSLNPYVTTSSYAALVQDKIFDKLFFITAGGESIEPRNAESWVLDGNTVTISLNKNAKWHDGQSVTAKDWVYTINLLTNPEVNYVSRSSMNVFAGTDDTGVATGTVGAEAKDDYTLVLTFKSKYTDTTFANMVENKFKQLEVLPEHILGSIPAAEVFDNEYWSAPIGSGPCIFESEIVDSTVTMKTNQDYYLGAPKFGKLVMMVVSAANVITSVEANELDYSFAFLSVDNYLAAEAEGLEVKVSEKADKINMLMINNETISDNRIRQAIQYAIDKKSMVDNVMLGNAVVAESYFVPFSKYLNTSLPTGRDVEKAKALLAEAGVTNPTYTLEVPSGYRTQLANMIKQDCAEAGITINIVNADASTMFADAEDGKCDMMIMADATANSVTAGEWYYSTENYYCHISDTTYDEKMAAMKAATDETELTALAKDFQQYCFEQSSIVPLFYQYNFALTSERLTNITPFDTQMFNDKVWEWEVN